MSPDRRPDDFNEAEKNAPNPVVEALAIWRETWQATPLERWNRLVLWSTMRDAARARRLLAEIDERAFCRGALEEVGFEAKKRRDLTAELAARLDDLIEASAASETAPTLAELFAVWNLSALDETPDADASDATGGDSKSDENAKSFPQTRANSEILYGGAGVGRSFTDESGAIPESSARPLEPGDVVVLSDDYEIKRVAGKGGQKAVYEVVSKRLGTRFAVKELLSELGGSEARRRDLEREVKIQARLQHQGIPKVFALTPDADPTSETLPRFVETYVEGEPWSARPFDRAHFEENLDILLQVAKIMAYAHDQGVVHRDLKPENVMLGRYGELYVVDWGLAFDLNEDGPKTGAVGTQAYLPPEQALRLPVDKRADVFSLGGILYKILTGFAPYEIALRTQGSYHAAKKAQACDFAPLEPEAAKTELLKLAEETLTSSDTSLELCYFVEKILSVVATPSEILTFAEKGIIEIDASNIQHENTAEFQSNDSVSSSFLNSKTETDSHDVAEDLRKIATDMFSSFDASDSLRRLAETTLIATISVSSSLRDIVTTALSPNLNDRFKDATAFAEALEKNRPQNDTLQRFEELKQSFRNIKFIFNNTTSIINSIAFENFFSQSSQILSDFIELRLLATQNINTAPNIKPLIQEIYNYEIGARYYLIDKALECKKFEFANQLVHEQHNIILEYIYETQLKETRKTIVLETLQKSRNRVAQATRNSKKLTSTAMLFIAVFMYALLQDKTGRSIGLALLGIVIYLFIIFIRRLVFNCNLYLKQKVFFKEISRLNAKVTETLTQNAKLRRENERLRRELADRG